MAPINMDSFGLIQYSDLSSESTWKRIGKGSFGCVYKGEYLGIEVAIKEVQPSSEYDVQKYFQREVKVMQEARHPNIVQFLGLSLAPPDALSTTSLPPAGGHASKRILIISEYLPRGNLRSYIYSRSTPFPWRLRISFATDIARSVAYLHARQCLHRDLKGENALVTENERIKICDFGFARIAAQNEDEMRRMSYCGTDGYMAPEILMGEEFHLPADIFSLGVIFVELITRTLVDGKTFARQLPSFGISHTEIRSSLTSHCPLSLLALTLQCLAINPSERPEIRPILAALRTIEAEILSMESKGVGVDLDQTILGMGTWNVGSVSYAGTSRKAKRPNVAPRLPSFEGRVSVGYHTGDQNKADESDDDDLAALRSADVNIGEPAETPSTPKEEQGYATSVIRGSKQLSAIAASSFLPFTEQDFVDAGSTLTLRPEQVQHQRLPSNASSLPSLPGSWTAAPTSSSIMSVDSIANATIDHHSSTGSEDSTTSSEENDIFVSTMLPPPLQLHRFSLVKPNFQRFLSGLSGLSSSSEGSFMGGRRGSVEMGLGSGPVAPAGGAVKCGICEKKLGYLKASLECDDCGFKVHIKCSDACPPGCGTPLVPATLAVPTGTAPLAPHRGHGQSTSKLMKKRPVSKAAAAA